MRVIRHGVGKSRGMRARQRGRCSSTRFAVVLGEDSPANALSRLHARQKLKIIYHSTLLHSQQTKKHLGIKKQKKGQTTLETNLHAQNLAFDAECK